MPNNHESIAIGFAPSNLSNYLNPGLELPDEFATLSNLAASNQMGMELELEGELDSDFEIPLTKSAFLGVHQPISGIDAIDQQRRSHSVEQIQKTMALASILNADYFTNHIQTVDYWSQESLRRAQIEASFEVFDELWAHHSRSGYMFPMLIENLEYPKYPATLTEILEVVDYLHRKVPIPSGIVIDIGHLWRSRSLIKLSEYQPQLSDDPFIDYLESTLSEVGEHIRVFHLTGCFDQKTHLMPDLNGSLKATNAEAYLQNDYDFRAIGALVYKFASMQPEPPFMVNEAIGYPYSEVIKSNHEITRAFGANE